MAGLLAARAAQIEQTGKHFAILHEPVSRVVEIAYKEFYDRQCPLKIKRIVGHDPSGAPIVEIWDPKKMILPPIPSI